MNRILFGVERCSIFRALSGRRWHLYVEAECSPSVTDLVRTLLLKFIQHTKNLQQ